MSSSSTHWTDGQTRYLAGHYGITSLAEFARYFNKTQDEVKAHIDALGLKARWLAQCPTPEMRQRQEIYLLMQTHKRYLPNGWLIWLAMGNLMLRSLGEQIETGDSFIEEIEEQINDMLDAIVGTNELTPLLSVGDILKGKDDGQAYRIRAGSLSLLPSRSPTILRIYMRVRICPKNMTMRRR